MKIKTLLLLSILIALAGCTLKYSQTSDNSILQNPQKLSDAKKLEQGLYLSSSGKKIKITNIGKIDFPESGPALVLNYHTEISINDLPELRKEADEIWAVFRKNAEDEKVKSAAIRAIRVEEGKGNGFVFEQKEDGSWINIADEEKKN